MKLLNKKIWIICALCMVWLPACGNVGNPASQPPQQNTGMAQPTTAPDAAATREITDMAGRKTVIPAKINKVYASNPVGLIMVYTISPTKLAGLNYALTPEEKKYTLSRKLQT